MTEQLDTYPDIAAVDIAQGRVNAGGDRLYTIDPKFRAHLESERVRLLEGLAYRASMAMEKDLLYRDQREGAHVANALLEFAHVLAGADSVDDIYHRIVECTARTLDVPEVGLWLQDLDTGEVCIEAMWGFSDGHRERALATRYPADIATRFVDAPEPFVYLPEEHPDVPSARDADDFRFAIAPFRFDGGRMGFLVAGAPRDVPIAALTMKMLAGLADQAKLAIAGAH